MNAAPYTAFGTTRMVPLVVFFNGNRIESHTWHDTLFIHKDSDWALVRSMAWYNMRIRVVDGAIWDNCPEVIDPDPNKV